MGGDFVCLFQYLEKENISIDKKEFLIQVQAHPDYPSLLSIKDTLSFFKIDNIISRFEFKDLAILPKYFLTFLKLGNEYPKLFLLQKKADKCYALNGNQVTQIEAEDLRIQWSGVVMLAESNELKAKSTKSLISFLPIFCLLLAALIAYREDISLPSILFFFVSAIGFTFSLFALKDLFGIRLEVINKICHINEETSCSTIINSKKWKIFEIVGFSDLSIIFFGFQILTFLISGLTNQFEVYFSFQKALVYLSLPVLCFSIYFQYFVEKKWCPICLGISSVIIIEFLYFLFFQQQFLIPTVNLMLTYSLALMVLVYGWTNLKKMLSKQKELTDFYLKGTRFMQNYSGFKNNLLAKERIIFPDNTLKFGKIDSPTVITIITNPFCGHCKDLHQIIHGIFEENKDSLLIEVLIKIDIENADSTTSDLTKNLINSYFINPESEFVESLNYWFEHTDIQGWMKRYASNEITPQAENAYRNNYSWCKEHSYNFTPIVFINGYEYPGHYNVADLGLFIQDVIEEPDFILQ